MRTLTKAQYDTDFVEWAAETAELLRRKRFEEIDLEHVAEEIEDLGKAKKPPWNPSYSAFSCT